MMLPSRLGCPMSQKTPNMGNPGLDEAPKVQGDTITIELFWRGVRDYLKKENENISKLYDYVKDIYLAHFCSLRQDIIDSPELNIGKSWNYNVDRVPVRLSGKDSDKLSNNLFYTEIDIVLQSEKYLFIGEAKSESRLGAKSEYVLVHQLIREFVMAKVLVDLSKSNKCVVPFVVGDKDKLANIKNSKQVKFMINQGWLNKKNILSWDCIDRIAKPGADYS